MTDRPLARSERSDLQTCEKVLSACVRSVFEAGGALCAIRNNRLYRETHSSFDLYVEERWGLPKSTAKRWIQAAEIRRELEHAPQHFSLLPMNEAQTLALAKLPESAVPEVWAQVVEQSASAETPITAASVEQLVQTRLLASAQVGPNARLADKAPSETEQAAKQVQRKALAAREGSAPVAPKPTPEARNTGEAASGVPAVTYAEPQAAETPQAAPLPKYSRPAEQGPMSYAIRQMEQYLRPYSRDADLPMGVFRWVVSMIETALEEAKALEKQDAKPKSAPLTTDNRQPTTAPETREEREARQMRERITNPGGSSSGPRKASQAKEAPKEKGRKAGGNGMPVFGGTRAE